MTEYLLIAVWRSPAVSPAGVVAGVVDRWAAEALAGDTVESCTVSFAEDDQGQYAREPDALGGDRRRQCGHQRNRMRGSR